MKKIATWLAIFLLGTLLGGLIVWIYGGFLYRDWSFSWQWSVAGQPLATFGAGIAAIIAAGIALYNGQKTRKQDKEQELRERFTSIVEMLSANNEDFRKRESGAYAIAALADDWATFHKDDSKSALQEQQVCLNILTTQLRDPITEKETPSPQLITFKRRVQDIIFSRFTLPNPNPQVYGGPWSNLYLDLEDCHFYNLEISGVFKNYVSFSNAHFHNETCLSASSFLDYIDFKSAHFLGPTDFSNISFEVHPDFEHTHFHDDAIFNLINFPAATSFCNATFNKKASFTRIIFNRPTKLMSYPKPLFFTSAKFKGSTSFEHSVFKYPVLFNEVKFYSETKFSDINFNEKVDFSNSEFHKSISFTEVEDRKRMIFYQVKFALPESSKEIERIKNDFNLFEPEFDVHFPNEDSSQTENPANEDSSQTENPAGETS